MAFMAATTASVMATPVVVLPGVLVTVLAVVSLLGVLACLVLVAAFGVVAVLRCVRPAVPALGLLVMVAHGFVVVRAAGCVAPVVGRPVVRAVVMALFALAAAWRGVLPAARVRFSAAAGWMLGH
jgi:hypothetical protein